MLIEHREGKDVRRVLAKLRLQDFGCIVGQRYDDIVAGFGLVRLGKPAGHYWHTKVPEISRVFC